jgi:hypothetical protein
MCVLSFSPENLGKQKQIATLVPGSFRPSKGPLNFKGVPGVPSCYYCVCKPRELGFLLDFCRRLAMRWQVGERVGIEWVSKKN